MKRTRKSAATELTKPAIASILVPIDEETCQLVHDLASRDSVDSSDLKLLVSRAQLSLALTICYDRRMPLKDPLTREIIEVEDILNRLRSTSSNFQDYVPLFRYWPWNSAKLLAVQARKRRDAYLDTINAETEKRMEAGEIRECLYTKHHPASDDPLDEAEITSVLITFLSGGMGSTSATILWALALLAQRPDVQSKIHQEITTQHSTLKEQFASIHDDKESCSYLAAFIRECLRFVASFS
jgi:3-hydroxyphenylacetate 6-hydroxylase